MPRAVPTQVVGFIEDRYGEALGDAPRIAMLHGWVRAIIALVDRLPNELLPTTPADFADLIAGVEELRAGGEELGPARELSRTERQAIREIHRVLQTCPDEAPAAGTTEPAFIDDPALRADLHRDLGEANRALQNGE